MLPHIEQFVKLYRQAGAPCFPLEPRGKNPATTHGVKDASLEPNAHQKQFCNGCNVGIATGFAFDVIDLDGDNAIRGFAEHLIGIEIDEDFDRDQVFDFFEEKIGPVVTTGKGAHIYCLPDPRRTNQAKLMVFSGEGVDYRTSGGYVVAPPSIHPSGREYRFFRSFRRPTSMAPDWLPLRRGEQKKQADLLEPPSADEAANDDHVIDFSAVKVQRECSAYQSRVLESNLAKLSQAQKGERNNELNTAAFNIGQVIAGDQNFERQAFAALANAGSNLGLSMREITSSIRSGMEGGKAKAKQLDSKKPTNQQADSKKLLLPELVELIATDDEFRDQLGFDLLAQRIIKLRAQPSEAASRKTAKFWSDYDSNLLSNRLAERLGKNIPAQMLEQAIDIVAHQNESHPVRDYLEKCEEDWDGQTRISEFLNALGADLIKPHRLAIALWLAGAAARGCAFDREVKFDSMLVLEGPQGCGKSTVVSILGGDWAADTAFNLDSKDAYQQLGNAWIHEWAEMAAVLKSTPERVKAFLSKSSDDYREAYARRQTHAIRHCAFVGTTNEDDYLRDDTGNRRYWPIACCSRRAMIDLDWLRQNRDQIWGEAMFLMRAYLSRGSGFAPMGEEIAIMGAYVQTRQQADELRDLVTNEIIRRFQSPGIAINGYLDVEVLDLMNEKEIKNEPSLSKLRIRRILKEIGGREVRVATKTIKNENGFDFEGATNASGRIRKFRFEHQPHSRDDFDDDAFGEIAIPSEAIK